MHIYCVCIYIVYSIKKQNEQINRMKNLIKLHENRMGHFYSDASEW